MAWLGVSAGPALLVVIPSKTSATERTLAGTGTCSASRP